MTKDELTSRLNDMEWDDFEVKIGVISKRHSQPSAGQHRISDAQLTQVPRERFARHFATSSNITVIGDFGKSSYNII